MDEPKPQFTWKQKRHALWRQLKPYRGSIALVSVLGVISAIANGIVPYITGKFFDSLVHPHETLFFGVVLSAAVFLLSVWAVTQIVSNVTDWIIDKKLRLFTTEIQAGLQARAFIHLLTLPIGFHKKNRAGELSDIINKAGWMLESMTSSLVSLAPQFLSVFIGIGISFSINRSLGYILLAGLALYLLILIRLLPSVAKIQEEGFTIWGRAYSDAYDAYANIQTVKQANAELFEEKKIRDTVWGKVIPSWYRMERIWANLTFSQRFIVTLIQAAIFMYSVLLVGNGVITIGDLIAFNAYAGMIIGPFVYLGRQWQTVQNGIIAVTRAELIFGSDSELYEPPHAIRLPHLSGSVEFDAVHFSYEPDQPEVLRGISFKTTPGEVIAFVGETGVGKSTTIELISGYYFATAGRVLIDGHDIRQLNLRDLRSQMAVVPQEVVLFNASIKDNIRYGRPDATDAEVEAAAQKAHADGFIEKFPKKYEQEVGERGIKLSVGQKQRVAIARAMLRNPRILVLDEPTSALDAETERFISKSLDELMQGRTTFIIAHRLSTVRKADKILVIKDGKIAESGNHDELIALPDGIYRHLYELHIGLHE